MQNRGSLGPIDIVYFAVVLIVGVGIYASLNTSLLSTLGATTTPQYAAASNVSANVYSGFQTIASAPTIKS